MTAEIDQHAPATPIVCVVALDREQRVVVADPHPACWVGRLLAELSDPELPQRFSAESLARLGEMVATGESRATRVVWYDGAESAPAVVRVRPIHLGHEAGWLLSISGSLRPSPVTAGPPASYQAAERLFLAAFESAPYAKLLVKKDGVIARCNRAAEMLLGYPREMLLSMTTQALFPEEAGADNWLQEYLDQPRLLAPGRLRQARVLLASGEIQEWELGLSPVSAGLERATLLMLHPPRATDPGQFSARPESFQLVLSAAGLGVWEWDLESNSVSWVLQDPTGVHERMHQLPFAEWEKRLHPQDRDTVLMALRQQRLGIARQLELEYRIRISDRDYRWLLARGRALCGLGGEPYRVVATLLDVTHIHETRDAFDEQRAALMAAHELQRRLLQPAPPPMPEYDVGVCWEPSELASGDFYYYRRHDDGRLLVAVGDVSGKGFGAALRMASVHAFLDAQDPPWPNLNRLMEHANRLTVSRSRNGQFVSLLAVLLDRSTKTLACLNAGHVPCGYVLDRRGIVRHVLEPLGPPLGMSADIGYEVPEVRSCELGDLVVLLSDGLSEAMLRGSGGMIGEDRLLEVVRTHCDEPASDICRALVREVVQNCHTSDDITALVARILPC